MQINLLYLTFGNRTDVHSQATFSIFSFLRWHNELNIYVITDQPQFYHHLAQQITIVPISSNELQQWEGKHHFFWRVKIKAIEKICNLHPGKPVMYVDTDTFSFKDFSEILNGLHQDKAFMHENEGALSQKKSKTEKKMWKQIKQKKWAGLTMNDEDAMWNAGVVATPNTQQNRENWLALSICDKMCEQGVTRRLIEQYALSLAYQHVYGLAEAKPFVAHYWSAKANWNTVINAFLLRAFFERWSFQQILKQTEVFDFQQLPILQRNRSTNAKLKKWVDRFFPAEHIRFIQS